MSLIAGISFLCLAILEGSSYSAQNIKSLSGTLKRYQFDDLGRSGHAYYLSLNESPKNFQIHAALIEDFDANRFIESTSTKDTLELAYLEVKSKLFSNKNFLLEVKQGDFRFLRLDESLEKIKQQKSLLLLISALFIITGFTILLIQRKSKPLISPQS